MTIDPSGCAQKIVDIHGVNGRRWLEELPETMALAAHRWDLEIEPPFEDLSYNYVAPARTGDGREVVVKAGVPSLELTCELEALRLFDGRGIAQLLDADEELGVLILERLRPGRPLAEIKDDEALTQSAVALLCELQVQAPPGHGFASVAGWAAGLGRLRDHFGGGFGPFPPDLVEAAESLFAGLIDPSSDYVLIHGDLHAGNILSAGREPWLAIDPKGVVGNPVYDVAVFAVSAPRMEREADDKRFLSRRIDQLAGELALDRPLIVDWSVAHCVLSGWWSYEDHGGGWENAIATARMLQSL